MSQASPHNLGLAYADVARLHGARVALRLADGSTVTHAQLDAMSNRIARHLRLRHGVRRGDVVALIHDKSAAGYAAMMACLKLGAIYVNLDETNPPERLRRILDMARPALILCATAPASHAGILSANSQAPMVVLEGEGAADWPGESDAAPEDMDAVTGTDPAYLMYTSGSTGTPKGAVIAHGAVLRFVQWIAQRFDITPDDVFSGLNPAYFDNSVFDFYGALFTGASLAAVNRTTARDAQTMVRCLEQAGCTVWFSVPSMLIYANTMKALQPQSLPTLRCFVFGGEGFPKGELAKLFARYGQRVGFVNVYGPTECTCICSAHSVTAADLQDMDKLAPLGRLNPDFFGLVFDEDSVPVAMGEVGELWLGGPQVGLGYYNDPERTAAAFVRNPLQPHDAQRLYRTGDLVRLNDRGMYEFVGRRDNQIKHMGYRIELEEIEAALCALPHVSQAGVIYRRLRAEFGQIEAFVAGDATVDEARVREELRGTLPDYMIPRRVVRLQELPKNRNGKVDRKALAELP
ncbi:amino acid adenylation domain-containing protein [Piscinibacter terrae]|uniref:Amino acid adenylation domain-containing protein n=1 Tax=Piscinibacter terrae TaxID=2496871 RepID=A0A3N7HQC2_9BURK|nr:amino acid adenylation domain-containing protein [Albitalea terrae]RQP24384.1 amino acid adenylation domain-containing protein [Albitalea terrae]